RSARAGRAGAAINLVTPYDVTRLQSLEEQIGCKMELYDHECVQPAERVEKFLPDVSEKRIHAKVSLIDHGFIEDHIEKKTKSKEESLKRKKKQMEYEKRYNDILKQKRKHKFKKGSAHQDPLHQTTQQKQDESSHQEK